MRALSDGCQRCRELEKRVDRLESIIEQLDLPSVTVESGHMEDLRVGHLPVGAALTNKTTRDDVEEIVREITDSDTTVRPRADRDKILPIHAMWMDLQAGHRDNIPSDNARRGARLFDQIFRRAGGDPEPKVAVTDEYYILDSGQARDVLTAADDITDGGVSKTVGRSMKAVQRFTKSSDCDCKSIGACDHGLVVFDDSGGTNKLRARKKDMHAYGVRVQEALIADDDGEQPSEAPSTAEVNGSAEAVDAELDALTNASAVTADSDTVVSNLESKASEQPIHPSDQPN